MNCSDTVRCTFRACAKNENADAHIERGAVHIERKPVVITNPSTSSLQPSRSSFSLLRGIMVLAEVAGEYQQDLVLEISDYVPDVESGEPKDQTQHRDHEENRKQINRRSQLA
jgi:hypothetical protein